ncbi:hypothetical protein LOTGIDRAFT_236274 [Lottia gigantea]|uniref:EF-hand domain-containing protein n=1 Tax=Lottia gigantea TaxID=225164 RepID=V3ZJT2_LOTGI|nr:hypothetical protein LOTGIDRAFT_236274 [Lottia gigantea]ESO84497.1 hypothetical protein LOTGIDRAFT_236274 [Lottia gigantea]
MTDILKSKKTQRGEGNFTSKTSNPMPSCEHRTKLQKQAVLGFKPSAFRRTVIDKSKKISRVKPPTEPEERQVKNWKRLNTTFSLSYRLNRLNSDIDMSLNYESDEEKSNRSTASPSNADNTRMVYRSACKRLNLVPSSTFMKSVDGSTANLNYQGLQPFGTRAVAMALVSNLTITELSLRGNSIGTEGLQCLVDMLRDNCALKVLDISDNDLSTEGAKLIAKIIEENEILVSLAIAGNKLREGDVQPIADSLAINTTLKKLDLSYNELSELGGIIIGKGLAGNVALTQVNLGWNHLRQGGVTGVANGLKENSSIRYLDLCWNGIGDFGARSLGQVLKENTTLEVLDLTSCRIGMDGVGFLMTEMVGNETLKKVILRKNPITSHGACVFLHVMKKHPCFGIEIFDISDICISQEFIDLLTELKETRSDFDVKHGGTLRGKDAFIHREVKKITMEDPLDVLLAYIKSNGMRLTDFFHRFDRDRSLGITKQEFITGIKDANLPLNLAHIEKIISRLDVDGNGIIDFGELLEGRQNHLVRKRSQQTKGAPNINLPASGLKSPCTSPRIKQKLGTFKFSGILGNPDELMIKAPSPTPSENFSLKVPILNLADSS